MKTNAELDTWRLLWQARADRPNAADLRDRVERETRRRRIALIVPVLVTIIIGGWTVLRAMASPEVDNIVLAVETWLFISVIWAGSLWIDRGTWRPLANTTAAFVDVSIRRCRSTLSALRFGALVYVAQFVFVFFWKSSMGLAALFTSWPVVVLGWVGGPVLVAFGSWYARKKRTELGRLLDLRRQLNDD
jgi:hypothetical protein